MRASRGGPFSSRPGETSETRRRRPRLRTLLRLLIAGLVLVGLWFAPTPYMTLSPGRPFPLWDAVRVSPAATVPAPGAGVEPGDVLLLTTMARPANPYRLAAAMLGLLPDTDAVPSSSLIPSGMTGREYLVYSRLLMGESVGLASVVAVRAAGGVSAADGSGVRVFAPMPGAGVSGLLPGDLLLSVGGVDLRLAGDVAPAVRGLAPGSSVPATVLRDGVSREILITLGPCVPDAEEMKLGAMLATENPVFHTHPEVSVDTGGIAGPSGGLALALAIYSKLTEEDLLRGRVVAATGQIREDGSVAPVGGIAQKARAAIEGRAEVFLVPAADAAAARAAAPSLLVIGVSDFSEAVSYLRE